ncbi:MAG: type III-A CRISPR-associated RAMP protein Csm3 [Candidatus Aminicenantes bacterium]
MTHKERTITKKIFIKGTIKTLTGLHIGGTDTGINIGGLDKGAVVRNSITNEPYIPGSSLKGKMRSLLEKLRGEYEINDKGEAGPSKTQEHLSARIFGISAEEDEKSKEAPGFKSSRIIVRDAFLTDESRAKLLEANLEFPFTETKTETSIDRVTSKANPRTIERVPQDSDFLFDIALTVYEDDNEAELLDGVFTAMTLVQEDYLGGHGSRGSGKIKFCVKELSEKTNEIYINGGEKVTLPMEKVPEIFRA